MYYLWLISHCNDRIVNCHRNNTACKAYHIYYQPLYIKSLVTSDLVDVIIYIFLYAYQISGTVISHHRTYVVYLMKLTQF